MRGKTGLRERERERETERERERQTDRQTDRQKEREKKRYLGSPLKDATPIEERHAVDVTKTIHVFPKLGKVLPSRNLIRYAVLRSAAVYLFQQRRIYEYPPA